MECPPFPRPPNVCADTANGVAAGCARREAHLASPSKQELSRNGRGFGADRDCGRGRTEQGHGSGEYCNRPDEGPADDPRAGHTSRNFRGQKMKLYRASTTVREFRGCKNVVFNWFRHAMPQGRRPFAVLIKDYEPERPLAVYTELLIEELFTSDEARQLKDYVDQHHGREGKTVIKEQPLPVENDMMGYGALAVGGGDDFYSLCEEPAYSLAFKVWGYYNLVGCTLIDNGDTYRHRLMIVAKDPDGTIECRMETNPEAAARERVRAHG
jgi:hypothetical protein